MKQLLLILFLGLTLNIYAQIPPNGDPPTLLTIPTIYGALGFDKHFYDFDEHYMAAGRNPKTNKYVFGMVYLDMLAGFSLHVEGSFGVDAQGHVFRDSTDYQKNSMLTIRLGPNTVPFAAIPDAMLNDLHVKAVPDWLAIYHPATQNRSSVGFKIAYGRHLNSAGAAAKAVAYLEDAYKAEPHAAGVEFELAYAYNVLGQYDKAITVLQAAIANAPDSFVLYSEIGFSYTQKKDYDNAVKMFKIGLPLVKRDAVTRMNIVTNLTHIYCDQQKFADAQQIINDLITDYPNNMSAYLLSAITYAQANDYDNAIKSYSKSIDVTAPQYTENKAETAITIAMIYRDKKNDHDQFVSWAQKARAWAPANGRAAAALKTMGF